MTPPLAARAALVVDDSPAMRRQLCQALERALKKKSASWKRMPGLSAATTSTM